MTNTIAASLGLLIAALLLADYALNDFGASLFLAARLVDLIHTLAFWR
ncbi:hypothetical protein ILP92_10075 [Maribius pontilimi]|uniref:Glyceraldehyde-3-phosphate dehydrogenase n=1 Tax=Palleronia pontilimi TaxID=1964209 RepID=A0A934IHR0_9RHOB|nr:hypothetical protein [Palleronia pontilimi]MBJ3763091.1 hypothetical protein [Palleronia pontilimi]